MNKRIIVLLFIALIIAGSASMVSARYISGGRRIVGWQLLDDMIDSRHYIADSIDDEHMNWGAGANQINITDLETTDNIIIETEIDASSELLAIIDDETGTGNIVFCDSPTFTDDITINSTGVKLTGDDDGAITFLGLGDGSDESITINLDDSANVTTITSSTDVTDFNFGTINLMTDLLDLGTNTIDDTHLGYIKGWEHASGASKMDGEDIYDDSIDDDSINFTDVTGADLTLTDCAAITSSGTITSSGVFDATGAVAMTVGSADITSMSFSTAGTGHAIFTFPNDVIGDADIDWGSTAGKVSVADLETTDNIIIETEMDASSELLALIDDETGTGNITFSDSPTFIDDITLAAAGVKLTGSDGILTFLGLGTGYDEDLSLDFNGTTNEINISTSTGVANIDFNTINIMTDLLDLGANTIDDTNLGYILGWKHVSDGSKLDGEDIYDDSIDDDSINWTDVTGADITYAEGDMTDSTIISADIKDGTIAAVDIATDAVNGTHILDDTIDSADYVAGSIDAEHLADNAATQTKIDTTMLRTTLCYFINGNATTTMLAANEHPKMQLKSGYAQLIEVADGGATTYTVQIYNGTSDFMTDTLTFTQGTEGVADTKAFTIDATNHTLGKANLLNITTAGTTVTLGEMIVCFEYLGVD